MLCLLIRKSTTYWRLTCWFVVARALLNLEQKKSGWRLRYPRLWMQMMCDAQLGAPRCSGALGCAWYRWLSVRVSTQQPKRLQSRTALP